MFLTFNVVILDSYTVLYIRRTVLAAEETKVTQRLGYCRSVKSRSSSWSQRGTKFNGAHQTRYSQINRDPYRDKILDRSNHPGEKSGASRDLYGRVFRVGVGVGAGDAESKLDRGLLNQSHVE